MYHLFQGSTHVILDSRELKKIKKNPLKLRAPTAPRKWTQVNGHKTFEIEILIDSALPWFEDIPAIKSTYHRR